MNGIKSLQTDRLGEFLSLCRERANVYIADVEELIGADDKLFSSLLEDVPVPVLPDAPSRLDVANAAIDIEKTLNENHIKATNEVWSWYAMVNLRKLVKISSDGCFKLGSEFLWVADSENWKRYYRHRVAGPWWLKTTFTGSDEDCVGLLASPASGFSDILEQVTSRQELAASPGVVGAATNLYYDPTKDEFKRGSGGKGAGSPRRLAEFVMQIDRTYDLGTVTKEEVLGMLPREFDRFQEGR